MKLKILAAAATALACGCAAARQQAAVQAERKTGWQPEIYYLYPGEPAPVEGPQLPARDFERLFKHMSKTNQEHVNDTLVNTRLDTLRTNRSGYAGDYVI